MDRLILLPIGPRRPDPRWKWVFPAVDLPSRCTKSDIASPPSSSSFPLPASTPLGGSSPSASARKPSRFRSTSPSSTSLQGEEMADYAYMRPIKPVITSVSLSCAYPAKQIRLLQRKTSLVKRFVNSFACYTNFLLIWPYVRSKSYANVLCKLIVFELGFGPHCHSEY